MHVTYMQAICKLHTNMEHACYLVELGEHVKKEYVHGEQRHWKQISGLSCNLTQKHYCMSLCMFVVVNSENEMYFVSHVNNFSAIA